MNEVSVELSRLIQRRIDALAVEDRRTWPVRVCREELNALPLLGNQIYLWALRADGAVLCLDHEASSLAADEETDPLTRFAVLHHGAAKYPELRALVPPPPAGARPCDACAGSGMAAAGERAGDCPGCHGLGWTVPARPAADWVNRIDRGDRLHLSAGAGGYGLVVGRIAGFYVSKDEDEHWCSPAGPRARSTLRERLAGWERGGTVTPAWQPNPADTHDPFDSLRYSLKFSGTGSGGSYEVELARQPDGSYLCTVTLHDDWDPAGGAFPVTTVTPMDAAAARAEVEREMRGSGRPNPFPAIVERAT